MSNRVFSRDELLTVLASMGVTDAVDVGRYGSGHINDTFKVETARGVRYILQRVNTDIFPQEMLKENILRVTRFLKEKGVRSLEVVDYRSPWRLYAFLEGYASVDVVTNPKEAELAAGAFAKFQNDLADMPEPRLGEIIPRFHDTVDRLRLLDEAIAADVRGRRVGVQKELDFVSRRREEAGKIVTLMRTGVIPERITHNDTKINNVMLAPDGSNVVIDLDTTMPGSALYDFGDMVRSATLNMAEDSKDYKNVVCRADIFEALAKGFLDGGDFLTPCEKANMTFGGLLMTLECGVRFLTDYLDGDHYFKIHRPEHNLDRCRTQFALVQSIIDQHDKLQGFVDAL